MDITHTSLGRSRYRTRSPAISCVSLRPDTPFQAPKTTRDKPSGIVANREFDKFAAGAATRLSFDRDRDELSPISRPNIPGVVYNGVHHTGDLLDFGPQFDDGILTVLPPVVSTPYKVYVPKTDSDGNDIGGIRTPDVAVPLATYTGWALRAEKEPQNADGCDASGQKLPFAATKTARLAAGDPRPSLAERYKDHATYVRLVTEAARRLQRERLLVEPDAEAYITAAETAPVP